MCVGMFPLLEFTFRRLLMLVRTYPYLSYTFDRSKVGYRIPFSVHYIPFLDFLHKVCKGSTLTPLYEALATPISCWTSIITGELCRVKKKCLFS